MYSKFAAIYARRSSLGERDKNNSLDTQINECRQQGEHDGYEVVLIFEDPGQDSWTLDRPQFKKLLKEASEGRFSRLYVFALDRICRDTVLALNAYRMLAKCQVEIYSLKDTFLNGLHGAMLDFMISVASFAAASEREKNIERQQANRAYLAQAGLLAPFPTPPYGFVFAPHPSRPRHKTFSIDTTVRQIVKEAFSRLLMGESARKICLDFQARGIPTPSRHLAQLGYYSSKRRISDTWYPATLIKMARDSVYCGKYTVNKDIAERDPANPGKKRRRPRTEKDGPPAIIEVPAYLDEATWKALQTRLDQNREKSPRRIADPTAALLRAGHARCGLCNRAMATIRRVKKGVTSYNYVCNNSPGHRVAISCKLLDALTWEWLLKAFKRPEAARIRLAEWQAKSEAEQTLEQEELAACIDTLKSAEAQYQNLLAGLKQTSNVAVQTRITAGLEATQQVIDQAQARIEVLTQKLKATTQHAEQLDRMMKKGWRILAPLERADFAAKRMVIEYFDVQVHIFPADAPDRFKPSWSFDRLEESWPALERLAHGLEQAEGGPEDYHSFVSPTARRKQTAAPHSR